MRRVICSIKKEFLFVVFLSFLCFLEYLVFKLFAYANADIFIDVDEVEHLRTSYNIIFGYVPFRDFFEHHHLLLSYLFAPIAFLFSKDPYILMIARFFIYVVLFLTVSFSFRVLSFLYKRQSSFNNECLSAILLPVLFFSLAIFNGHIFHFRPDLLMTLFLILSIFFFFQFLQEKKYISLSLSFVMLALSFLTLQKALIYLPIIPAFCLYLLYKREIKFKSLLLSGIPAVLLVSSYVYYLFYTDSLGSYFNCNVLVNKEIAKILSNGSLPPDIFRTFLYLSLFCVPLFLYRHKNIYAGVLVAFFMVSFVSSYFLNPFRQYLIPSVVFIPLILVGLLLSKDGQGDKKSAVRIFVPVLSACFIIFQFQESVTSIQRHIRTTNKIMEQVDENATISEAPLLWFNLWNPSIDYYEFYNDIFSVVQRFGIPLPHFTPVRHWITQKPKIIIVRWGFPFPKELLPFYQRLPNLPEVYLRKH